MNERKLIDRIYEAEEECHDFLQEEEGTTQKILLAIDDEIEEKRRELEKLKKARSLYERLDELGFENREQISDFIFDFGKKLLVKNPDDKKDASFYFELAADCGGIKAKAEYAKGLIYGTFGVLSPEEGVAILREMAESDVAEAAYLLYILHGEFPFLIEGQEAKENYEKAARLGYAPALEPLPQDFDLRSFTDILLARFQEGDLSVCFELSKRKDISEKDAKRFLTLAAKNRDPKAEEEFGFLYKSEGNVKKAKESFIRAGEDGLPHAYLIAASLLEANPHFYEGGEGDLQKEEFHLYELAAKQDVPEALTKVGQAYRKGYIAKQSRKKTVECFRKAIRLGEDYEAPVLLAEMYRKGEWVSQNVARAASLFKKAANRGNMSAMLALSEIYEKGEGNVKKDVSLAARYRFMSGVGRD